MNRASQGFTLIELSIVLVIIGLIVGGVLVGQDLIRSAGVRALISQIEKYQTAVNTFRAKYNALPGDLNAQTARQFGFAARGTLPGEGDGNGVIEGIVVNAANGTFGGAETTGETAMFWVDLTYANGLNVNLIDGGFRSASSTVIPGVTIMGADIDRYFPQAKIGGGNYIYVWSGGLARGTINGTSMQDGTNYFGIAGIDSLSDDALFESTKKLTALQSYNIDKKLDDGLPQSGNVMAQWVADATPFWAGAADTAATAGSASTCYDNSSAASGTPGVNGGVQHYTLEISNGAGVNCALSFKFQ